MFNPVKPLLKGASKISGAPKKVVLPIVGAAGAAIGYDHYRRGKPQQVAKPLRTRTGA